MGNIDDLQPLKLLNDGKQQKNAAFCIIYNYNQINCTLVKMQMQFNYKMKINK